MNSDSSVLNKPLGEQTQARETIASDSLKVPQIIHFFLFQIIPCVGLIIALVFWRWFPINSLSLGLFTGMWFLTQGAFTVGWHRLFSHRAFKTTTTVRVILAILGSMAAQGPLLLAVAEHRRHHEHPDKQGDPHSPHLHPAGWLGRLQGLWHSHVGWLVTANEHANTIRYVPDLLRDKAITSVSRYYLLWVALGLAIPTVLGGVISNSWIGACQGFLWGGLVRMFFVNNLIGGVNSIVHVYGSRGFNTDDHSQNNFWLALPTLGEAWHNNHHAFPQSAIFGLRWWQFDIGGWLILILEKLGLAWNVKTPASNTVEAKKAY
jgi:stearoyl-CoA desaturase (delta-9 desaturase)